MIIIIKAFGGIMRKPTKIISAKRSGKSFSEVTCDNGKTYTVAEMAKVVGIHTPSMRQRLINWGYDHPNVLRKKSPCKVGKQRDLAVKLDITPGDLVGKFNGRRTTKERRQLLDAIPSPSKFEKLYC